VTEVNRKALLIVLTLAVVLLATPYVGMVYATSPTDVLFYVPLWTFGSNGSEYVQVGNSDTWIEHANTYGALAGDIVGAWTAEAYWVYHKWVGPYEDPFLLQTGLTNGHILQTIEVTAVMGMGKTGTIKLEFNDVFGMEFGGTWTIHGGTGELKGLHGQGTWVMNFAIFEQVFEGQVHFDP